MEIIITNDKRLERTRHKTQTSGRIMHRLQAGAQNIKGEGLGWEHKSEENCQKPVAYSFTVSKRADLIINFKVEIEIVLLSS